VIRHLLASPERFAVVLAAVLALLAFARWAFVPPRHVPRFRVATLRLRVQLRLHPGRGFAWLPELWWRWGRLASFRESGQCRPGLPLWYRALHPSCHAVYLGRAHYRHRLWQAIQENILIIGRSRSGKSGWLAKVIIWWRGAAVSATTKTDLFMLTSGLRARWGRPVFVFNPQGLGGYQARSTMRFDPVAGCQDETTAMRRGTALTDAVRVKGAEDAGFWNEQAAVQMPALLSAAALDGRDLQAVADWVLSGDTRGAERILRAHGRPAWAAAVAQLRGPADKTAATVRMVLVAALRFLQDPALAECVTGPGEVFDIPGFLCRRGTLYLIADQRNDTSPVAPLFACLVAEIHWIASQLGSGMRGGRLDPPLLLQLDEVTRICPIPVPALLADSGGRGITMIIAAQGLAQIEERWSKPAARSVLDTSNQIYVSGVQDPDTLKMASDLCDTATYRTRGKDGEVTDYPVATPGMIRRLPRRRALVLRADCAPVITHLPMAWNDWRYRWAKLRGRAVAEFLPATSRRQVQAAAETAAAARMGAWDGEAIKAADEAVTADLAAAGASGNGHRCGTAGSREPHPWDQA
jgi:type IV secretory pathway TraG/TraD family ATPase VirD4